MAWKLGHRLVLLVAALSLGTACCTAAADAALDMSTGLRYVVQSAPADECNTKAKTALDTFLQDAFEAPANTGQWLAYGPVDRYGHGTAAAAIHCFPVGNGYVVTFTCAVESPPNPYSANDLCTRLGANFSGKPTTPLATPVPVPVPTGCSTVNLVGKWSWDDKPGAVFVFDADGGLTDNEDVSGSWSLSGNTVTMTYYGTNTLTLSPDGKKLSAARGVERNFTRQC